MFNIKRNREQAMAGVVVPVVQARSLGADVLADVAARYGVGVAAGARAVQVPQGAHAETYAINAMGHQVWVQGVLAVDGVVTGDVVPVGYYEARSRAASSQIKRRAAPAAQASGRIVLTDEARAARDASRLAQVREMVSLGHIRVDIMQALGMSHGALQLLTAGLGIVWPRAEKVPKVPKVTVAKAKAKAAPMPRKVRVQATPQPETSARVLARAAVRDARRVQLRALAGEGWSQSYAARKLGISWKVLNALIAGTDIVFASGFGAGARRPDRVLKVSTVAERADQVAQLRKLAAQGLSRTQAAVAMGFSLDTLRLRVVGTDIVFACGRGGGKRSYTPRRKDPLIASRDAQIVEAYKQGVLQRDIAVQFGLAFVTISGILRREGVEGARQRASSAQVASIADAVRQGGKPSDVAAQFGISMSRLRSICSKAGVRCAISGRHSPAQIEQLRPVAVARVLAAGDAAVIAQMARDMGVARQVLSRWVQAARRAAADAPAMQVAA